MSLSDCIAPVTHVFRRHATLQKVTLLASGSSLAQVCMIINGIVLARHLTPDGYGAFAGTFAAVSLAVPLFSWGLDTWLLSRGAIADDLSKVTGTVLVVNTISAVAWGTLLFFALPLLGPSVYLRSLVLVSLVDTWGENLFAMQLSALTVLKRVHLVSSLLLVSRGGRLLSVIILMLVGVTSPVLFAEGRLVATLTALVMTLVAFRPRFTGGGASASFHILRQSIPFAISDLFATIYLRAGIALLAIIVGQSEAVGQFSAAYGLLTALFVIPSAGYSVMVPELAWLNSRDRRQLGHTAGRMFAGFVILGILLGLGTWIVGGFLTELLLGSAYHTAGELLSVLSPILLLKSLGFAGITLLVAVGWQRYRVGVQVVSAIANVLASVWLVSQFGVFGLAGAYLITEVVLTLGYGGLTMRWLRTAGISVGGV